MLTEKTLNEFALQANYAYQEFRVWVYVNNEFVKHQQRWNQIANPSQLFTTGNFSREKGCKYKNFWSVVIPSLQYSWFLSLARLFDPAYHPKDHKKTKPRLSFEYILILLQDEIVTKTFQDRINKYQSTLDSIKKMRDNLLAHKDLNTTTLKISGGIEDLFKELDQIISDIKRSVLHLNNCNNINLEYTDVLSRCGVDEIFEALLRNEE